MSKSVKTIADIARLAGVSKSTVSRALNNSPLISEETRKRIQDIAREHNFTIHQGARCLSLKRTQIIAFVIPIEPDDDYMMTDPFINKLVGTFAYALNEYNYDLLIAQPLPGDHSWIQQYFDAKRVDGFILCGTPAFEEDIAKLVSRRVPFIVHGRASPNQTYCGVSADDLAGGRLATQHLIQLGRKRIAFLGGVPGEPEVVLRYQAYEKVLREHGYAIDPALVTYGDYTHESGYEAMQRLLQQVPALDAVFANSDVMAVGAMEALGETGRNVPKDVSVVGYDDTIGAHCNPPLTTIRQDIAKLGRVLVHNLMQHLEDGIITTTVLPVELVVRKSSDPSSCHGC
jgi:DNA-binding LacI/PurR family transcriptional regulator